MKTKKASVNRENWQTTRSERLNYYIGDLGRTLEGYIVTAFMTLFLLFQGINLVKISAAILIVKIIDACDDVIFGFLIDKLTSATAGCWESWPERENICRGTGQRFFFSQSLP